MSETLEDLSTRLLLDWMPIAATDHAQVESQMVFKP